MLHATIQKKVVDVPNKSYMKPDILHTNWGAEREDYSIELVTLWLILLL